MVDAPTNQLLSHNGHGDADQVREELWASSVRRYNSRKQEDLRAAWASYHRQQAERLEQTARELAAEHRLKAKKLMENGHEETT